MVSCKTIRSMLVKKIGQRTMYSKMDKIRKKALHSITTDTALHIAASQENIPVAKILKKERMHDELHEFQDAVTNFDFSTRNKNIARRSAAEPVMNHDEQSPIAASNLQSVTIKKIITIGEKYGIENIDSNWIDALAILNFIETITTKFLMDHDYSEEDVKNMKWEEKLTKLQNKLFEEGKAKNYPIRTSIGTFFKNYREVRNRGGKTGILTGSHFTTIMYL